MEKKGEVRPVVETIQRIALVQPSLIACGIPMTDEEHGNLKAFSKTLVGSAAAGRPAFLLKMPGYSKAKAAFHRYLGGHLANREKCLAGAGRRADLIDTVLHARYADDCPFDEADRLANAHSPYVKGISYGGRVAAHLLYGLFSNTAVCDRIIAEIDDEFAIGTPTLNDLRRMVTVRARGTAGAEVLSMGRVFFLQIRDSSEQSGKAITAKALQRLPDTQTQLNG